MLEDEGFTVATATSARAALEQLATLPCDAIVCDMRMPEMDGPALWREVSAHHSALQRRMLFASGDTLSPGVREFIKRSGCLGLPKPFARADLLAGVRSLLQS
ncbi:MAG TPA: response regulator [Albitalea sp.]|uniref:response regulator n=1 Tax=Piscinibacter sp. TaxID=1903157 RepID=UPI002ED44C6F